MERERRSFTANDRKLEELVLYLAVHSEGDSAFSDTKLNKLLFYCDFLAYAGLGRPITGHRYQKLPFGPAPVALLPVLSRMEERGDCARAERTYFGRKQKRVEALREADLSVFTSAEIHLVDEVLEELRDHNARQVSDLSHTFPGWQAVGMQEEIPYETAFVLPPRPLTVAEIEHARKLAKT